MPYIKPTDRPNLDDIISTLDIFELDVGDINYLVTKLLKEYISIHGENYENYNSLVGVLECIKQEFYRRQIAPYEDIKIRQNGDV
jgi:hypothetical protein